MLFQNFSRLTAKFAALLVMSVLFLTACSSPVDSETTIEPKPNQNPKVVSVIAEPASLSPSGQSQITVTATDPDNDELTYSYELSSGKISGSGKAVTFTAGTVPGTAYINVKVTDTRGGTAGGYVMITIR